MINSSKITSTLNQDIEQKRALLDLLDRDDLFSVLSEAKFDWDSVTINVHSELGELFESYGWVDSKNKVSRVGQLIYGRLALHFQEFNPDQISEVGDFTVVKRLKRGKNSAMFLAKHSVLGYDVVLKFIRPGASINIEKSLRKLSHGDFDGRVVMPTHVIKVPVTDILGKQLTVICLAFPYIRGISFKDFLADDKYLLNPHLAISFIKQVGNSLAALERINAYHGDLHEENLLVCDLIDGPISFKLLDISFDAIGSRSLDEAKNNDLADFKQLIWRILNTQQRNRPSVSLKKFIGSKYFRKIEKMLSKETTSFESVMKIFEDTLDYKNFDTDRREFFIKKFEKPSSFRIQRYEEFSEPEVAAELFVPFPELKRKIDQFSNAYVSGNRGSGKSTYLASLGFFPSVKDPIANFKEIFGVYFPCRQGEFKNFHSFSEETIADYQERVLHILIIKIIRRTLEALTKGISHEKLLEPNDIESIRLFLNNFVPDPGIIPIEADLVSKIQNYLSTFLQVELLEVEASHQDQTPSKRLAKPSDLITFFKLVRSTFSELSNTQFHILFDDAGSPYVCDGVQFAINDLIISSNPVYCIKLSAEKKTFKFLTSDAKAVESGHDFFEYDISYSLFFGGKEAAINLNVLEAYCREIIEERLKYFGFQSNNILDYLGDPNDTSDRLVEWLYNNPRRANYHGWHTVWNVADRTPRNLLELVSEIFTVADVNKNSAPMLIHRNDQNRAIKTVSEKRLRYIAEVAGVFEFNGKSESLGGKLNDITATLGAVFKEYLRQDTHRKKEGNLSGKVKQCLAIERNDLTALDNQAQFLLNKLITFGVLDDSKSVVSRDDNTKKRLFVLNRIYCPVFNLTYNLDQHLRLSHGKLNQLLLLPQKFKSSGTERLRDIYSDDGFQSEMFIVEEQDEK